MHLSRDTSTSAANSSFTFVPRDARSGSYSERESRLDNLIFRAHALNG